MAAKTAILVLALLAPAVLADSSVLSKLRSSQFSGFQRLLEQADLMSEIEAALKSGKGLTVFAPTDDALLYHTSPTLLAFLKAQENKAALRTVLLSHFVAERLSPFQWEGAHKTLGGSDLPLAMDAQAFYAGNVAVLQYNAVVASDAAVHSVPTLIIPASLSGSAQGLLEESTEARRFLLGAGPAPAPAPESGDVGAQQPNAAFAQATASFVAVAAASVAALLL